MVVLLTGMGRGGVRCGPTVALRTPIERLVVVEFSGWVGRSRWGRAPRRSCVVVSTISVMAIHSSWRRATVAAVCSVLIFGRIERLGVGALVRPVARFAAFVAVARPSRR